MPNENSGAKEPGRWLPSLLRAHALVDAGTRLALRQESVLRGRRTACREGCANCCARGVARATAVELAGAMWHLETRGDQAARDIVLARAADDRARGCPFLVDGACAVYPMRFMTCRQLFVFNRPCAPGEDPWKARRADVFTPLGHYGLRAFAGLLPLYGVSRESLAPGEVEVLLREASAPVRDWALTDLSRLYEALERGGLPMKALAA